jgi:calcium-dependent protein kinase
MAPDEVRGLRELFAAMDTDSSGTITLDELRQGLASRGAALPEGELAALMDLADVDHNRELDYQEFVAATMHACRLQHEQLLIQAFQVRCGARSSQTVLCAVPAQTTSLSM